MKKLKERNQEIAIKNKQDIRKLEKFYVDGIFENMGILIEEKKEELVNAIDEFQHKHIQINVDRFGNETKIINPYLIATYFFKPLNPMASKIPTYNAEKLALVWDLYMYLVEQVNINIDVFIPSLTHFCKFAGITLSTIQNYRNNGDEDMCILVEKIFDEVQDSNLGMAQKKKYAEKSTMTRLKIENEVVEKVQPRVNINIEKKVDLNEINKRLEEIRKFNTKIVEMDTGKTYEQE